MSPIQHAVLRELHARSGEMPFAELVEAVNSHLFCTPQSVGRTLKALYERDWITGGWRWEHGRRVSLTLAGERYCEELYGARVDAAPQGESAA